VDADAVLEGLDPEQRDVVLAPRGPLCVLAGAGTGKTRALTHRIAYRVHAGQTKPSQVLAVSFTTRAAGELRTRLRTLGVDAVPARTFHSAALRQLRFFWPRVVGGEPPQVTPSKLGLLAEAATRCRLRADRALLRDLASEVEWAKVTQTPPDDYATAVVSAARATPGDLSAEQFAHVYAAYEVAKREAGRIDFEDVLLLTVAMLQDHPAMLDEVRSQYRHFLVDEFQDVSPIQHRLLELWRSGGDDLTVVGDASQTIYSFTGASPTFLLDFPARHPGATVVRLVRDYRSTPQVVGLANQILARARGTNAALRLELVAQRPPGPDPTFAVHADEPSEAAAVAEAVQRLIAGGLAARDIAVLYRVNAQSESYEEAFAERGIPYLLRGGERFFERPEVRQAVMLLRGAARGEQPVAADLVTTTVDVLAAVGYQADPPAATGAVRERWESLAALVSLAQDLVGTDPAAPLSRLVAELEHRADSQHAPAVDGVTFASLHSAKGLEWTAVFLVGLVDGTLPISHAQTEEQIEEERRLLYVGVTRARENVGLSWARARSPGSAARRTMSRFLDGIAPRSAGDGTDSSVARGGRRQRRPSRCRVCGRALSTAVEQKLRHCSSCEVDVDLGLFERLRTWRLDVANAAHVPAFVVFTDATLTAIAQDQPTSVADLLAIPGVGARKLELYGADVLAVVAGDAGDKVVTSSTE
jgi:DNA helicase-2/ATP-dependent DNA helicase PcrA